MTKPKRAKTRREHLTERRIGNLPAPAERTMLYDLKVRELGLKLEPSGRKVFFWFRAVPGEGQPNGAGRPTWKTIGPWPDIPLDAARAKAEELNVALASWRKDGCRGQNPFEPRRDEPTLDELIEDYISRHVKAHASRPERAEAYIRWAVGKYLGKWRGRRLSAIRRKDVLDLHDSMSKKNGRHSANRTVQLLRALYNFAGQAETWAGENPAARVRLFHEAKRTRYLQPDEMPRLFAALKTEENPDVVDFVNLSLWTGARKSDVLAMRWQDISLADNSWTVPDPKNRTPYSIALTPEAVAILKKRRNDSSWVFPSFGKTGHVIDLKGRWKQLLKRAEIENLRQHDLRRTLGSWQAAQGASLQIIGKSLGHRSVQATAVYSQLDLDPVRESVTAATRAILVASKKKPRLLKGAKRQ